MCQIIPNAERNIWTLLTIRSISNICFLSVDLQASHLQVAEVEILNNTVCKEAYEHVYPGIVSDTTVVCAGGHGADICKVSSFICVSESDLLRCMTSERRTLMVELLNWRPSILSR